MTIEPPLPSDPQAREQLLAVRSLRAQGLKRREIAAALGVTPRRVSHLEAFWGHEHSPKLQTPGFCWAVRRVWALGQHRTARALAAAFECPEKQIVAILAEERGTHARGWGDEPRRPPVGRRSRARGASADDLAPPKPGARGRAPTRFGPVPRAPLERKDDTDAG